MARSRERALGAGAPDVAITIPVEDSEALAKLRRLALEAQRTRAALSGLPEPGGLSPGGNLRTAPMPRVDLGGGSKADQLKSRLAWRARPGSTAAMLVDKASAPGVSIYGERTASTAAASRAESVFDNAPVILPGATNRASKRASSQNETRTAAAMVKASGEGVNLGRAVQIGANGVRLANIMGRMGPAAGYGAALYGSVKLADRTASVWFESVDIATRTGQPVSEVFARELRNESGELFAAVARAAASVLVNGSIGLGRTALAVADATGLADVGGGVNAGVKRLSNRMMERGILGLVEDPQRERERTAQRTLDDETTRIIRMAEALAEKTAMDAALQLRGAGFPGTATELAEYIKRDLLLSDSGMQEAVKRAASEAFSESIGLQG